MFRVSSCAERYLVCVFDLETTVRTQSKALGDSSITFRQSWLSPNHVPHATHQTKALEVLYQKLSFPQQFEGGHNSPGSDPLREKQFETAN